MMRVVLTTGGTGGHIFPALAVAEQLRGEGVELLFVGSQYGPEAQLASQAGLPFKGLAVRGVLGRGLAAVSAAAGLMAAVFPARRILADFRPDVVAGFGAYASLAPLLAARSKGLPIAVHEQNAMPGVTNRFMGKVANRIFLSIPVATGVFPAAKCVLTGNPVRAAIAALPPKTADRGTKRLLVMGGSQGAKAVNSAILANLERFRQAGVEIRHQTGKLDLERVRAGYLAHGIDASGVTAFIDDMAGAYAWADMALCRAGATSVAELAAAGLPSLLIPFPYATHDHQTHNARALEKAGAARLMPEQDMARTDVGGLLLSLFADQEGLAAMSRAARATARPDAAAAVARGILSLAAGASQSR